MVCLCFSTVKKLHTAPLIYESYRVVFLLIDVLPLIVQTAPWSL